jgi:hypothetical protein
MISRLIALVFALLSAGSLIAKNGVNFEYGPRPAQAVFDPAGFLDPQVAKEISDPLSKKFRNGEIDVLVIVLTDLGDAPPAHVARRFAQAWSTADVNAIVLHVPGRKDSPWIVPAGNLLERIDPAEVSKAVERGQLRAAQETTEPSKVRTAAREAVEMLQLWKDAVLERSKAIRAEDLKRRAQIAKKVRFAELAGLAALVSVIPIVVGIFLLVKHFQGRRPSFFPSRTLQPRLGAPHSGGNHAVVELGPLPLEPK